MLDPLSAPGFHPHSSTGNASTMPAGPRTRRAWTYESRSAFPETTENGVWFKLPRWRGWLALLNTARFGQAQRVPSSRSHGVPSIEHGTRGTDAVPVPAARPAVSDARTSVTARPTREIEVT